MNTPKIIFKYSPIYNDIWKGRLSKKTKNYPSEKQIINYIKVVEKLWRKDEKKILKELSQISQMKWRSKTIDCFVVGRCIPFSWPLTMPIYEKHPDYFIDILIHELIHDLFVDDMDLKKSDKAWQHINQKYKNESRETKGHIIIHAIHTHIYLKFYNEKRLKRDIKLISFLPDYKRSWDIVQKEGYHNIIQEFQKRIKK